MPNTLAHAGFQGVLSRGLFEKRDVVWILLGCVIPDVPWILQRAAYELAPGLDVYLLRSYAVVQASLLGGLVLSAAIALLARRPGRIGTILGVNVLLHLILDALQTKWGNGVHFLAPFTWETVNVGLFWPENPLTYVLTAGGLIFLFVYGRTCFEEPPDLVVPRLGRALAVALLVTLYFAGPLLLVRGPVEADAHSLAVLSDARGRIGRPVAIDRAQLRRTNEGPVLRYFGGSERVSVEGLEVDAPATVSVRGVFVDSDTVRVLDHHVHGEGIRDYFSYAGVGLIFILWMGAWIRATLARR